MITIQFTWSKDSEKPIGSSFIGTSPEFEMAVYSVLRLLGIKEVDVKIADYDVEMHCYPLGYGVGTAYPVSKE